MAATLARDLAELADSELRSSSRALATRMSGRGSDDDALISQALALYSESSRRFVGTAFSRHHLVAAAAMCIGLAAELPEPANGSAGLAAYWFSLHGRGVHVILADDDLAHREARSLAAVMDNLHRRVALLSEGLSDAERRDAYRADITVGASVRFMGDFLRDKLSAGRDESIQRDRYVAVVGDGSAVALGHANLRYAFHAPRASFRRMAGLPDQPVLERAAARVVQDDGLRSDGTLIRFNSRGISALAEELSRPAFSPEFSLAADEIRSQLQSSQAGRNQDSYPYVEISLFAYLRQYERLACTIWSVSEDGADLARIYGLSCVPSRSAPVVVSPGLPAVFAGASQQFTAVRRFVEVARNAGSAVMIRAARVADANRCAAVLAAAGIAFVRVRPDRKPGAFARRRARTAVTIVDPGVVMPQPLDSSGAANGSVFLAIGIDLSQSFLDWQWLASAGGSESWILVSADDPLLPELDREVLASLRRLPDSFDVADPDRHAAIGADLYRSVHEIARYDRMVEFALRSSVEKQAEVFYEWRDFLASAPADDVVARLIEEYLSDLIATGDPDALQRGVAAVTDGSPGARSGRRDAGRTRARAKTYLMDVYDEVRTQSDPTNHRVFIREVVLHSNNNTWSRFLNVAAFIRSHVEEAYPSGERAWIAGYRTDVADILGRLMRDFRRDTLQRILSTTI